MKDKPEYYNKVGVKWDWKGKNKKEFFYCLICFIVSSLILINNILFYVSYVEWDRDIPTNLMFSVLLTAISGIGLFSIIGIYINFPKRRIIWRRLK
jgi:uncharacterized integral membrane protein